MVGTLQPLDQKFPVVDNQGRPTEYFTRWAQQKQIDIGDAQTEAQVQALIEAWASARQIIAGRALDGGGFLSGDVTIDHGESLVTPGTYGSATKVPQFVVDQEGHIQGVVEVAIAAGGGGGSLLCPYPSGGIDPATSSAVATSPAMLMIGGFTGASTTVKGIWLPCRSVVGRVCVPALYDAGLITAGTPPTPTGSTLVATGPSVPMADNKIMYMPFTAPFATVTNHYYFLSVIYSGLGGSISTMALPSGRRGWFNLSGVTTAPATAPAMTNHNADFYSFWND